jgi:hypothetical protein
MCVHRKTNTVHWVLSSIYYWCSSYVFRHLRAILRERLCPCEYVKTGKHNTAQQLKPAHSAQCLVLHTHKDKDAPWGWHVGAETCRSCINNKYLTKPSAQCWFFYAQPSNARYKHQTILRVQIIASSVKVCNSNLSTYSMSKTKTSFLCSGEQDFLKMA